MLKINELQEKRPVEGNFLVTKKDLAVGKTGKPYLALKLMDSTGEVEGRGWDNADILAEGFKKSDVCRVKGFVVAYQGKLQINVSQIAAIPEGRYDLRDFLPSSERDPEEMIAELDSIIDSMTDKDIKTLLKEIFKEGGEIRELYKLAPAAKAMHHPYLGGLIEHVLSVCGLARFVSSHYEGVDGDMLLAGVMLHDIGKIYELSYKRGIDYTDRGKLIGHITIGVEMIEEAVRSLGHFPREKSILVKHLVLSHHGIYEYGSPKRPKTVEAILLSFIDDVDAKVKAVQTLLENDLNEGNWTAYNRMMERYIFKGFPPGEELSEGETVSEAPPASVAEETPDEGDDGKRDPDLALF